ncbi:CHASE domain-containing protein [Bremerella cremea]|uniref:CHASE domain-containing protein n=1 Tax=Bremerella cremea TaxID=1031537 RepID=UPI0031E4EE52
MVNSLFHTDPSEQSQQISVAWWVMAARLLLAVALIVAAIVMIAWPAEWTTLRSLIAGLPTMKFNTALGLATLAAAGLLRSQAILSYHLRSRLPEVLGWFVLLLSLASIFENLFLVQFGIDTLVSADPRSVARGKLPGLMSTGTAIGLSLLSGGFLLSVHGKRKFGERLLALGGLLGVIGVVLYIVRASGLRSGSIFSTTAIHTAILLVVLASGIWLIEHSGASIRGRDAANQIRRELSRARWMTTFITGTLLLGFFVTSVLVLDSQSNIYQINQSRFQHLTEISVDEIGRRINRIVYGLRGARGLYLASELVTRKEFETFVESRDIEAEFPGAIGIGLIQRVMRSDLDKFIAAERKDEAPDFDVLSPSSAPDLYVIKHIYPLDRNRAAWGFDIGSEPTRRTAAEKAMMTGKPQITGRIELLQDDKKSSGFLYFLPVYKLGAPVDTPNQREENLIGLLYSPIILNETLDGIDKLHQGRLEIEILDSEDSSDPTTLYEDAFEVPQSPPADDVAPWGWNLFRQETEIIAGGRHWIIVTRSSPDFELRIDRVTPSLIGVGGTILTFLLVSIVWSMGRNEAVARNLYHELQDSEASAKAARANAEEANRAKSEFLANMSHEIRTPMNAIIGLTDSVLRTSLTSDQRDYLLTVSDASNSLLRIINDILDFSRIEAGKLKLSDGDFQPRELIANVLKPLSQKTSGMALDLVYHVDSNVPEAVHGDAGRIRQILFNLVGNAIKFTPSGQIDVGCTRIYSEGDTSDIVELQFTVRDTGVGIPGDKLESIFNVFEQADNSLTRKFGGTGLGLTISSRLVHLMGGAISVTSEPGTGSVFRFTTRLRASQTQAEPAWHSYADQLAGKRVMVVDDNIINLETLVGIVASQGLSPEAAETADDALHQMQVGVDDNRPFDVLLTDMRMPDKDGIELISEIRRAPEKYGNPISILVSSSNLHELDPPGNLNICSRIMKPARPSEVVEAIAVGMGLIERSHDLQTKQQQAEEQTLVLKPLNILLAEDSRPNQKVALAMLKRFGHTITIAETGKAVLELLETQSFDVILMDVQMPEMDGLTATQEIRKAEQKSGQHMPIVATTAHALPLDQARCLDAGVDSYVSKPLSLKELNKAIHHAILVANGESAETDAVVPATESETSTQIVDSAESSLVPWDNLKRRLGNDEGALLEIVQAYLPEMRESQDRIRRAFQDSNGTELCMAAHKLKSALQFFQQKNVSLIAQRLETQGSEKNFSTGKEQLSDFNAQLDELFPILEKFIEATQAKLHNPTNPE